MKGPCRVAFVSAVWTTWQHRLMAGALRYVDTHPRLIMQAHAPAGDLAAVAADVNAWGAKGALVVLEHDELDQFREALGRDIPLVNNALTRERPNVATIVADFSAFVETAADHLRQMGCRSLGLLVLREGPSVHTNLTETFLRRARPPSPEQATLVFAADRELLWHPHRAVKPVPKPVAKWLNALPKPAGILCPNLGGGGYLIRCCRALGLNVPKDIAVVGGDDTDLSLACEPTLTCVLPALETLGFEAMKLLMQMIGGKPPASAITRLGCIDLHVRESTGSLRSEICDISAALECIKNNATRGITVGQVIRQTQRVSKVTFHRRFQELVGKSPAEAIRERKLQEVRRLLASTELPVSMVSELCGFSSAKVLARSFRKAEKVSPRDYRKTESIRRERRRPARGKHAGSKGR